MNRSFLIGLGTGVIAGALLLQLIWVGQGSFRESGSGVNTEWTQQQLEAAAAELNLKVYDESAELLTSEQWEQKLQSESNNSSDDSAGHVTENPVEPEPPSTPDVPNPSASEVIQPNSPEAVEITYHIDRGSSLSEVAKGLEQKGIIGDSEVFIRNAMKKKVSRIIQSGKYTFMTGEDEDSIIHKISTLPSDD